MRGTAADDSPMTVSGVGLGCRMLGLLTAR